MIVTRSHIALLFCQRDLYEGNLRATMPIREKLWRQLDGFATRLLLKPRIG